MHISRTENTCLLKKGSVEVGALLIVLQFSNVQVNVGMLYDVLTWFLCGCKVFRSRSSTNDFFNIFGRSLSKLLRGDLLMYKSNVYVITR